MQPGSNDHRDGFPNWLVWWLQGSHMDAHTCAHVHAESARVSEGKEARTGIRRGTRTGLWLWSSAHTPAWKETRKSTVLGF